MDPRAGFTLKSVLKNVVSQAGLNTSKQYNTRQRQKSNPKTGNDQIRHQTIKNQQGNNPGIKTRETKKTRKLGRRKETQKQGVMTTNIH